MQAQLQRAPASLVPTAAAAFRNNIRSLGGMTTETMRVASASEEYTKALQKQDITMRQALKSRQTFNQVLREQYALSRATSAQWTTSNRGRSTMDLIVPTDAPTRLGNFRQSIAAARTGAASFSTVVGEMSMKMGIMSQVANSGAANMIKWGKNTQWAGRQLMVGLTAPVVAAGAAMGVLAYKVEAEMTRIVKVYDFQASKDSNAAKNAQENASLRANSFAAAKNAAQQYGAAMEDTLKVEANLAATGETGRELIGKTTEVMRLATLGEMDYQQALETTITLQSVYHENTSQLAESFNYMNAVENATSLSIDDFSKAIPKVAAPLKTLNGTLQDAGTLLVAMRARGINAVEGANAIKASFNRILNPTRAAKDMFKSFTEVDLVNLVKSTKGEVIPTFVALQKATANLSGLQKQQLFGKLFGTQQTTRLQGIVEEMANLKDETTQVGKAYAIAGGNASDWAASADREMKALQSSPSGQLKIAIQSLKVELAEAGKPFLTAAAYIVGGIMKIVAAFNQLPSGVKTFLSLAIVVGAVAGPVIMLVGLFANLVGQAVKLGASMLGLVFRFRALLPEQVASRLAAMQGGEGLSAEAASAQALTATLTELTAALARATGAQVTFMNTSQGLRVAPPMPTHAPIAGPVSPTFSGFRDANGQALTRQQVTQWQQAQRASTVINTNSGSTRRNFQMMGGAFQSMLLMGGMMGSMATDSGTVANNIANAAVAAGLIATVLAGPLTKFFTSIGTMLAPAFVAMRGVATSAFARIGASGTAAFSRIGGAISGATAALGGFTAIAGTLLAVAIAVGAAWYIMNKNIKASREEQERVADSAKAWGETLGFAYQTTQGIVGQGNKNIDSLNDKMNTFKKNNKDAYNDIQKFYDASEAEKWARAIEEGTKVRLRGGTKSAAEEATKVALGIMGKEYSNAQFTYKLKAQIDFDDISSVVKKRLKDAATDMKDAVNKTFDQGKSESFGRFFAGESTIQQKAGAQIKKNAEDLWDIYDNTQESEKQKVFAQIAESVNSESLAVFEKYQTKYKKEFEKLGIATFSDWNKYLSENTGGGQEGVTLGAKLGLNDHEIDQVKRANDAVKGFNKEFGELQGLPNDKVKNLLDTNDLKQYIPELQKAKVELLSVANAETSYFDSLRERSRAGVKTSEADKLATLNIYRRMAGLEDATKSEQLFQKEIDNSTDSLKDNGDEFTANADNVSQFVNSRKSAMSGTMNDVFSRAEEIMNEQQSREVDSIGARSDARSKALDNAQEAMDKRFDARQKTTEKRFEAKQEALDKKFEMKQRAFDTRWDNLMDKSKEKWDARTDRENAAYDAKIQRVKDAIKAEEDAESKRQEIFEREKTRIQRAAQMANQNIDFNMAINSGNLDEAAKIGNNMQADINSWQTADTAAASQNTSEQKIAGLNTQITTIEAERDKRMKILQQMEEAEKKVLEARKQREQDALNAQREAATKSLALAREKALEQLQIEREAYQKNVQAQREALAQETKDKVDAVNRKYAAAKRALEDELAALKAFVPRNQKELDEHIKAVEQMYGKYGVNLQASGNNWSKVVADALRKNVNAAAAGLKSDIAWDKIGKDVAGEIAKGAFGLTLAQFSKWVSSGELPSSGLNQTTGTNKSLPAHHEGGMIGSSIGSGRTGYSGGRAHSEVDIRAKKGEYMMKNKAVDMYGKDFMDNVNAGRFGIGGAEPMGLAGLMGANMAGMMQSMVQKGIRTGADSAMMTGVDGMGIPGMAGAYGGIDLSAEQLRNAATIIATGKSMGATPTDLIVSIMTAMQESTLQNLNYGDRDSLGLFQQRPSQGWGTAEQIRTPSYAARKFFDSLLAMKGRAKLPLYEQAQRVQRSAFPFAYAKWEAMARAVVSGTGFKAFGNGSKRRPVSGPVSRDWAHHSNLPRGTDFGVDVGTPVFSAMNGAVTTSEDLRGNGNQGYRSYGRYIVVQNGDEKTLYAHLSQRQAQAGAGVKAGQLLGYSGNTGNSTGPHLHFETWRGGASIPPGSFGIPGMNIGGKIRYDNTIANLHKNEAVLTAPLTAKLERGIDKIDSGSGNTYNFTINADAINTELDFEKIVTKVLSKKESDKGRSRVVK